MYVNIKIQLDGKVILKKISFVEAQVIPIVSDETGDRETTDAPSHTVSKSVNSLKSLLKSKGEIKGKNGANYQRHGSFCINSLGLPAEDFGVIFFFCFRDVYSFNCYSLAESLSK